MADEGLDVRRCDDVEVDPQAFVAFPTSCLPQLFEREALQTLARGPSGSGAMRCEPEVGNAPPYVPRPSSAASLQAVLLDYCPYFRINLLSHLKCCKMLY